MRQKGLQEAGVEETARTGKGHKERREKGDPLSKVTMKDMRNSYSPDLEMWRRKSKVMKPHSVAFLEKQM
jgi:hypothetical protein